MGNIKSATCVTNLVVTHGIIVAWGSRCIHTINCLHLVPIHDDCLTQHLVVATTLLVVQYKTSLDYWLGLPA